MLTCAAFWLQRSISPLVGWAAKAAPARITSVRALDPMNRQNVIGSLLSIQLAKNYRKFRSNAAGTSAGFFGATTPAGR